jgi:N-acetylated-alpha-linked acidic dipeptidase
MATFRSPELERRLIDLLDDAEPRALLERFASLSRVSGSAGERLAADYLVERLRALGLDPQVHEASLYLSIPERAELRLAGDAAGSGQVTCRPPAFSRSTNGATVEGEVVYVPSSYPDRLWDFFAVPDAALPPDGEQDRVRGSIVLTEGYGTAAAVLAFERRGALAQIYIHPGEAIHEGICTPVWGAPTHESIARRPRTPIVCVNRTDGERLIQAAVAGARRASVATWLQEGWVTCPLPVVDIHGSQDPDEFLLVHGHYDGWHHGIGDNATGAAALLELARVLHRGRTDLKRTVRLAWWPGHETGQAAGSAWYADAFADEIDEWCIAQMQVDSPGCAGATAYDEVAWMAEAAELCIDAIADATGRSAKGLRPPRAGDYSFNQIGATGLYMWLSAIPRDVESRPVPGCGGSPVWHTAADALEIADLSILRRDLQVYLTTIVRVVNAPLHPFDYTASVLEIGAALQRYQAAAGGELDLNGVKQDLSRLRHAVGAWRSDADTALARHPGNQALRRRLNATVRRLARLLVALAYARGERFDHDPAVPFSAVPRLEAALHVASAPEAVRPFLRTALVRERNKVWAVIREALTVVSGVRSDPS